MYEAKFVGKVPKFIRNLPQPDRAKIAANIKIMEEDGFDSVHIKTLRKEIKELIIKSYRLIFFIHQKDIYFVRAFIKKSQKTPKLEIDEEENTYKTIIQNEKNK